MLLALPEIASHPPALERRCSDIRGIDIELAEECLDVSRREHAGRGPEDEVRPCSGPPTQHQ